MAVTAHDVARLAVGMDVPAESFVRLAVTARSTPDSFLLSPAGPAEYRLLLDQRTPAGGAGEGGAACVFLMVLDEDGRARCGAYAHRPGVCRAYPFFVAADADAVAIRADAGALCPDGLLEPTRLRPQAARPANLVRLVERDVHRLAIDAWNRAVAGRPDPASLAAGELLRWLLDVAAATEDLLAPIREDGHLLDCWARSASVCGNPLQPRTDATASAPPPAAHRALRPHLLVLREAVAALPAAPAT